MQSAMPRNRPWSTTPGMSARARPTATGSVIRPKLQSARRLPLSLTTASPCRRRNLTWPSRLICDTNRASLRRVAPAPNGTISTARGNAPNVATCFERSAMITNRRELAATIFSRTRAPPPPLIRSSLGSISSAPSIVRSSVPTLSRLVSRMPSAVASCCVASDVGTATMSHPPLTCSASNGSKAATVEPVPRPSSMPVFTSASAARAAAAFSSSLLTEKSTHASRASRLRQSAHQHVFEFGELVHPVTRAFTPDSRFLDPSEGRHFGRDDPFIDPDYAILQGLADPPDTTDIAAVEIAGKAELGVVGHGDCLLLGGEAEKRRHRAEGFLSRHGHVACDVAQDGRLEEIAAERFAAHDQPGTLGESILDMLLDLFDRRMIDQRAGCHALLGPRPDLHLGDGGGELLGKLVVDLVLHQDAVGAYAGLPGIAVFRCHRPSDRRID